MTEHVSEGFGIDLRMRTAGSYGSRAVGLALGHGSAHLESSDVVPRANTKHFGNMLRPFGSLAPPTQSLTAFLSAQSFLKIGL